MSDTRYFPVTESRSRAQSMSSGRHPSPTLPTNTRPHEVSQAPTTIMTSANTATNRSNRASYVMNGYIQQKPSAFVHGQPSPPLEPDEFLAGVINSSDVLREMPSVSTLSLSGENSWFDEDSSQLYDVSDNVQQLIRETDEAFKAVSSALAEARMFPHSPPPSMENLKSPLQHLQHASRMHEQAATAKPGPTHKIQIETASPSSPTPAPVGRDSIAPRPRKASKPYTSLNTKASNTPKHPVIVTNSVAKPKKGPKSPTPNAMDGKPRESSAPAKVQFRGTAGHSYKHGHHHSVQKSITKLNQAADKVTDKLSQGRAGRLGFFRIEADEVVTSEQVEQFRQNRIASEFTAAAKSPETLGSVADLVADECCSDADVEPFSPEDLLPRIEAGINALSPVVEVATPDFFELNKAVMGDLPILATRDSTRVGQDPLATPPPTPPQYPFDTTSKDDESMHLKNLGLSKLAHRQPVHKRSGSSVSHIALLPTIPEVKIKSPLAWDASRIGGSQSPEQNGHRAPTPTDANGNPYFEEDADYMFFISNPVTATMPTFQHGRICLAKADLVNAGTINSLESKLLLSSPDETLDWTAFQMAILGGAGDLFSDPDNFLSRDAQEEMVDDLCDWLEDLAYTTSDLGALTDTHPPRKINTTVVVRPPPLTPTNLVTPGSVNRSFHDPTQHTSSSSSSHRKAHSGDSSSSSTSSLGSGLTRSGDSPDHSIPIAVETEHPSGFWNSATTVASQHGSSNSSSSSSDSERFHGGPRLKRWTLEGHPKRYQGGAALGPIDVHRANNHHHAEAGRGKPLPMTPGSAAAADELAALGGARRPMKSDRKARAAAAATVRESIDSLPQSPMLELRMMTGVDGSKEFVSMGYNLNHDLGDFLKWESEHVYASGFYGADE